MTMNKDLHKKSARNGGKMFKTKLSLRALAAVLTISSVLTGGLLAPKKTYAAGRPAWYLCQGDYTRILKTSAGDKTVRDSGCNVTCIAMASRILLNNYSANPETMFLEADRIGLYRDSGYNGLSHDAEAAMCNLYGLTCNWTNDTSRVLRELKSGAVVIFNVGSGPHNFISNGHYIVLYGTEGNKVKVYDPNTGRQTRIGTAMDLTGSNGIDADKKKDYVNNYGIVRAGSIGANVNSVKMAKTTLTIGEGCDISGTVSFSVKPRAIYGNVYRINSKTPVASSSWTAPNDINSLTTDVDIRTSNVNKDIHFGTLGVGDYYLEIAAYVTTGKCMSKKIYFSVVANEGGFVNRLYSKALGRNADSDGYNFWRNLLVSKKAGGKSVASSIINSGEFARRNLSNEGYVELLYNVLFDRSSDKGGFDYWVGLLRNGTSRASVLNSFLNTYEFTNLCKKYGINP